MRKNTILIISNDIEYITNVECLLTSEIDNSYSVEIITDNLYLEEYLKSPHKISALLIDENMVKLMSAAQIVGKAIIITEGEGQDNTISKLDGAEGILRKLGPDFLKSSSQAGMIKSKIIDVVSVDGGSGKTATALGLCLRLSEMRKKVLYIDAENMQNFYEYFTDKANPETFFDVKDVNHLMDSDVHFNDIDSNIVKGKFDYLAPLKGILLCYQLDDRKLQNVAAKIAAENIYDYVVVEHGNSFDMPFFDRLNNTDKIVISALQGSGTVGRLRTFWSNLKQFEGQAVVVCNRFDGRRDNKLKAFTEEIGLPLCECVEEAEKEMTLGYIDENQLYKKTAEAIL